ncbi:MAG: 4-alpha-glucanotransferase [Rhodospirillaceae bacterium]|nr:4-alpha-glucanotransferase [Rhodospirillaceae bacterium]
MMRADRGLARLVEQAGIESHYYGVDGKPYQASLDVQRALLEDVGLMCATPADIRHSLHTLQSNNLLSPLPPMSVLRAPEHLLRVTLPLGIAGGVLRWCIGDRRGQYPLNNLPGERLGKMGGREYGQYAVPLPADLPLGYHDITIETHAGEIAAKIAVAPAHAMRPEFIETGQRLWGIACHLYGVRSERNWGIGDFGDLETLTGIVARHGGEALAINPLHALFPGSPEHASPYWPSSRRFLNPLYIDLSEFPEVVRDPAIVAGDAVAYRHVAAAKMSALKSVGDKLIARVPPAFFTEASEDAWMFACHSALSEHFGGLPWHAWPPEMRRADSPALREWAKTHINDLRFHLALQWLAEEQLRRAGKTGMKIGLVRDLAVGASPDGADVWSDPTLFALGSRFGAPPDPFASQGQDWGMPPINPRELAARGFAPFIAMLQANMAHAGGLRIDHVSGLQRLFWIPKGASASQGAYIRYPMNELFGLLALESHLNKCLLIGEDLGNVPEGFRDRMERECMFSTRLFYFERYPSGLYKRPDTYPPMSVAQATTHDLPTLAGFWQGRDIAVHNDLDRNYESETAKELRHGDRALIVAALIDQDLLEPQTEPEDISDAAIIRAIHRFLTRSSAGLALINLSDVMIMKDQLNIPGTISGYPNWRLKLPETLEKLEEGEAWRLSVEAVRRERSTTRSA